MPAISADKEGRREYRERLWRSTPHPKLFPLSRLLVSIVLSGSQSGFTVLRHRWNPNVPLPHVGVEMFWFIVVAIIVYMVIYALEWSWNYVALAPMIVDSDTQTKLKQRADEIATLTKENEGLKQKQTVPELSPQEQRRRDFASVEIQKLGEVGRTFLRYIGDQGHVNAIAMKLKFGEMAVSNFIARAIPTGLISYENHVMSIKPELTKAVEFVLSSEYDQDLKD